jgi:parallel beta-helix repeat protein
VFVKTGTYTIYGLTIDKSLWLMGENKQDTLISAVYYGHAAVAISADNVNVSGLTVEGAGGGIEVDGSGCRIIGNNLFDNAYEGIGVRGSNNTISGNNVVGNPGHGIYVESSNTIISNNNVANNSDGIIIDSCDNVNITQNTIMNNSYGGLSLRWYGNFYVYNNNITDNAAFGIQLATNCSKSMIYNNDISRNQIGINLAGVFNQTWVGVGNSIFYNNIVDNNQSVSVDGNFTDKTSWDNGAVGNYWSDYNGKGDYKINQNNIDHYPLAEQVDTSTTAPAPTTNAFPILPIAVIVALFVVVPVSLLLYRRRRRGMRGNTT